MLVYVDTSALVKLIVPESGSKALRSWIDDTQARLLTADLTRTEFMRVGRRAAPEKAPGVTALLQRVGIVNLGHSVYADAGLVAPPESCGIPTFAPA